MTSTQLLRLGLCVWIFRFSVANTNFPTGELRFISYFTLLFQAVNNQLIKSSLVASTVESSLITQQLIMLSQSAAQSHLCLIDYYMISHQDKQWSTISTQLRRVKHMARSVISFLCI
jgi:predicted SnoaL-like aldol condensation-catalyzing enzyme